MRREREAATQQLEEEAEVRSTVGGLESHRKGLQLDSRAGTSSESACSLYSVLH